jgi:hypothetical protein
MTLPAPSLRLFIQLPPPLCSCRCVYFFLRQLHRRVDQYICYLRILVPVTSYCASVAELDHRIAQVLLNYIIVLRKFAELGQVFLSDANCTQQPVCALCDDPSTRGPQHEPSGQALCLYYMKRRRTRGVQKRAGGRASWWKG